MTIGGLNPLNFNLPSPGIDPDQARADLVEFLKALTDDRVRRAAAPFDHPQIFVPNGHLGDSTSVTPINGRAVDSFLADPGHRPERRAAAPRLPGVSAPMA